MAQRIGLADVAQLPDPQLQYQFTLLIPTIPGWGSGYPLAVRCKSASIPGITYDDVEATLHGVTMKYAGRPTWDHSQQITLLETRDFAARSALKAWAEFARNAKQGTGNYASVYKTVGYVQLFDDTNKMTRQIKLFGCFVQTMDAVSLDGSSSSPVELSATLSYDWTDEI